MTVEQAINHLKAKGMWLCPMVVNVQRALHEIGDAEIARKQEEKHAAEKICDKAGI